MIIIHFDLDDDA